MGTVIGLRNRWATAEEVGSARCFLSIHLVEALSASPITVKNNFSLSAVSHDMSRSAAVETNGSVVLQISVFVGCVGDLWIDILDFFVTAAYVGRYWVSASFPETGAKVFSASSWTNSSRDWGKKFEVSSTWYITRWTSSCMILRLRDTKSSSSFTNATNTTCGNLSNLRRSTLFCFT